MQLYDNYEIEIYSYYSFCTWTHSVKSSITLGGAHLVGLPDGGCCILKGLVSIQYLYTSDL